MIFSSLIDDNEEEERWFEGPEIELDDTEAFELENFINEGFIIDIIIIFLCSLLCLNVKIMLSNSFLLNMCLYFFGKKARD